MKSSNTPKIEKNQKLNYTRLFDLDRKEFKGLTEVSE
jgi:hypothetical protein